MSARDSWEALKWEKPQLLNLLSVFSWDREMASRKGILTPSAHEAPLITEKALASRSMAGSWKFAWTALFLCLSDPSL